MHLGGAPGCGKTYIGKQIKSKYNNLKVTLELKVYKLFRCSQINGQPTKIIHIKNKTIDIRDIFFESCFIYKILSNF